MSLRVLVVDDEAPARERLRSMLAETEGFEVAGEAENGRLALELCDSLLPDIVLLDVRMPGIDGIEVARHLEPVRLLDHRTQQQPRGRLVVDNEHAQTHVCAV